MNSPPTVVHSKVAVCPGQMQSEVLYVALNSFFIARPCDHSNAIVIIIIEDTHYIIGVYVCLT